MGGQGTLADSVYSLNCVHTNKKLKVHAAIVS